MSDYLIKGETLTDIANALREKTGKEDTYTPEKMSNGVNEVFEAGKEEGLAYWNAFTVNGSRRNFEYAFIRTDFSNTPLISPLVVTGANHMFRLYSGKTLPRKQDIDMTRVTEAYDTFGYLYNQRIVPDYGIPAIDRYQATYDNAQSVETIEVVRCHEGTIFTVSVFAACYKLKNIIFEGIIGRSLSMSVSPLSLASLKNIISCLKDYSGVSNDSGKSLEYAYTVTFKISAFEALEAEGFTEEDKVWLAEKGIPYSDELTWATVIDNLKWNLTLS